MNYSNELPRHGGNLLAASWECWGGVRDAIYISSAIAYAAGVATRPIVDAAWAWYVEAFFSPKAMEIYEVTGQLLMAIAIWVYAQAKDWADAQVQAAERKEPKLIAPAPVPQRLLLPGNQPTPQDGPAQPQRPVGRSGRPRKGTSTQPSQRRQRKSGKTRSPVVQA
jgi:hypothetical protein